MIDKDYKNFYSANKNNIKNDEFAYSLKSGDLIKFDLDLLHKNTLLIKGNGKLPGQRGSWTGLNYYRDINKIKEEIYLVRNLKKFNVGLKGGPIGDPFSKLSLVSIDIDLNEEFRKLVNIGVSLGGMFDLDKKVNMDKFGLINENSFEFDFLKWLSYELNLNLNILLNLNIEYTPNKGIHFYFVTNHIVDSNNYYLFGRREGKHFVEFKIDKSNVINDKDFILLGGFEIKGKGKYVVCSPSSIDGKSYKLYNSINVDYSYFEKNSLLNFDKLLFIDFYDIYNLFNLRDITQDDFILYLNRESDEKEKKNKENNNNEIKEVVEDISYTARGNIEVYKKDILNNRIIPGKIQDLLLQNFVSLRHFLEMLNKFEHKPGFQKINLDGAKVRYGYVSLNSPFRSDDGLNPDFNIKFYEKTGTFVFTDFHNETDVQILGAYKFAEEYLSDKGFEDFLKEFKRINYNKLFDSMFIEYDEIIKINKYISEEFDKVKEIIDTKKYVFIESQTGTGKTSAMIDYVASKKHNINIIAFPLVAQAEQSYNTFMSKYGKEFKGVAKVFKQGVNLFRDKELGDEILLTLDRLGQVVIFTTYNSSKKIFDFLKNMIPDDYQMLSKVLILDEVHTLINNYKDKKEGIATIRAILNEMNRVVFLTGTPYGINFKFLEDKEFYYIKFNNKESDFKLRGSYEIFKLKRDMIYNLIAFVYNVLPHTIKKNMIDVVLINDKSKMKMVYDYLNRFKQFKGKIAILSSEEKEGDDYKYIVNQSKIPDGINLVLTTSVISDGVNILNDNINNVFIYFIENRILVHQFIARFRFGVTNIFEIKNTKVKSKQFDGIEQMFNARLSEIESALDSINNFGNSFDKDIEIKLTKSKIEEILMQYKDFFYKYNNRYYTDNFYVQYQVLNDAFKLIYENDNALKDFTKKTLGFNIVFRNNIKFNIDDIKKHFDELKKEEGGGIVKKKSVNLAIKNIHEKYDNDLELFDSYHIMISKFAEYKLSDYEKELIKDVEGINLDEVKVTDNEKYVEAYDMIIKDIEGISDLTYLSKYIRYYYSLLEMGIDKNFINYIVLNGKAGIKTLESLYWRLYNYSLVTLIKERGYEHYEKVTDLEGIGGLYTGIVATIVKLFDKGGLKTNYPYLNREEIIKIIYNEFKNQYKNIEYNMVKKTIQKIIKHSLKIRHRAFNGNLVQLRPDFKKNNAYIIDGLNTLKDVFINDEVLFKVKDDEGKTKYKQLDEKLLNQFGDIKEIEEEIKNNIHLIAPAMYQKYNELIFNNKELFEEVFDNTKKMYMNVGLDERKALEATKKLLKDDMNKKKNSNLFKYYIKQYGLYQHGKFSNEEEKIIERFISSTKMHKIFDEVIEILRYSISKRNKSKFNI